MTAGSQGPLGHMYFLKHLIHMMTTSLKNTSTEALQVHACLTRASFPLAKTSHVANTDSKGREGESYLLKEEKNSFLQSLIIFLLAIILHNPFTHKSYLLCPKTQNSHPGLESRIK